jgi:hypothetical protein
MAGRNTPIQDRAQQIVDDHEEDALWLSRAQLNLQTMPAGFPAQAMRLFQGWHRQGPLADTSLAETARLASEYCEHPDDAQAYDFAMLILQQKQQSQTQHAQRKLSVVLACLEVGCTAPLRRDTRVSDS